MEELEVESSFIRSEKKIEKDKRDLRVFFKFHRLMEKPDAQPMVTKDSLAKEEGVTRQTVYNICTEVPEKLSKLVESFPEFKDDHYHYLANSK